MIMSLQNANSRTLHAIDVQYKAVIVFRVPKSAQSAWGKQTPASRHIPNYILKNKQTGACKLQHLAAGSHAFPSGK